jgi:putative hemolysin
MAELIVGFLAIFFQGLFAGTETAYTKARWIRLRTYANNPKLSYLFRKQASIAQALLEEKEKVLFITLIFTNIFTVLASVIITQFFITRLGAWSITLAMVIVAILALTLGDFLPKILAQTIPEYWAVATAFIIKTFKFLSNLFPVSKDYKTPRVTRYDFIKLLEQKSGAEIPLVTKIAKALLGFSSIAVKEILVPKEKMVFLKENDNIMRIKKIVRTVRFSRYPVCDSTEKNFIGIVHIKDILRATKQRRFTLKNIIRPLYRVNAQSKATTVLREMIQKGEHLAIVEDEAGNVLGMVTLEDLLEELIGEIRSEA